MTGRGVVFACRPTAIRWSNLDPQVFIAEMQQQYGYDREIEAIVDLMDRVSLFPYLPPSWLFPLCMYYEF